MDRPEVLLDQKKSQLQSFLITRRALMRGALSVSAMALIPGVSVAQAIESGLTPAARGEDGSKHLTDPNWKPAFLNDHQNGTLIALSEVVIPATDTPGAKEALVNRFLDLLLSIQPEEMQKRFTDALASIDSESQKQFSKNFLELSLEDQVWLIRPWAYPVDRDRWIDEESKPASVQQHFLRLKQMIANAYYGSEIGQKELGWDGEFTHGPYTGCDRQDQTHT
jgi:glucoside 3-dehydrogenase (cytochrome c) hitch-hiker subunit